MRALRAHVPCVLSCSLANVPCVLMCSRANVSCVLTCRSALRAYMLTCQLVLRAYVLACLRTLRAYVLTCQRIMHLTCSRLACFACSRANVPCVLCVPTCSRAITISNKDKFSITCFPYIFVIVLCLFFCEIKLAHSCIFFTNQKPLAGAMTNFV